jgi:hypothetical protein
MSPTSAAASSTGAAAAGAAAEAAGMAISWMFSRDFGVIVSNSGDVFGGDGPSRG